MNPLIVDEFHYLFIRLTCNYITIQLSSPLTYRVDSFLLIFDKNFDSFINLAQQEALLMDNDQISTEMLYDIIYNSFYLRKNFKQSLRKTEVVQ